MAAKGNFSNQGVHTFNPRKHNIGVRLQQGVPILDRDWNEMEDIRRYFERMLKKWYIGNGVPKGSKGFKIVAPPNKRANDFLIKKGRCMVNGYEVENEKNIYYSKQISSNAELLTTPTANRKFLVYLEVWTRTIDSKNDSSLSNAQDINMETCVRDRLFWKVGVKPWDILELPPIFLPPLILSKIFATIAPRTALRAYAPMIAARSATIFLGRTPLAAPLPTEIGFSWKDVDDGNIPSVTEIEKMTAPEVEAYEKDGRSIYPLAFIARKANNSKITDEMILDLRQTNLNLSRLTRRVENLESELFLWDVAVTPEKKSTFYGSPVEITVEVKDAHGPRKDAVVEFSTDFGSFNPSSVVTDEFGRAKATLVGSIVDETPTLPEIKKLKGIHKILETAYLVASPTITSFVGALKFSSTQMGVLERHFPEYIYRSPLVDKAILKKPPKKISIRTATLNIRVKYSSKRPITKGLGSTQVVFRQWIKPWLTHFIHSAFENIKQAHIKKVNKILKAEWDSENLRLKAKFASKLTTHMDDIQVKTKDYLVKNMVVEETTPSLRGIGELVHNAVNNMTQETTVSSVKDTIGETTGVNEAISGALIASGQSVGVQKMKAAIAYKRPEIAVWSTNIIDRPL